MDINITRYRDDLKDVWNKFVFEKAKNATFLHSRDFYLHNPLNQADDHSLIFYKEGSMVALLPANEQIKAHQKILNSYMRSTYGGLLIDNKLGMTDLLSVLEALKIYLADNGFNEAVIRPSFRIYHNYLSDEIDYALWKVGFAIKYREVELAIDVRADIESNYNSSTLRSIKKAYKSGVMIRESDDLEGFWNILETNLAEKHGLKPVHTIDEIKYLISLVGNDKVRLFIAELNGVMIGGILVFIANKLVTHAQYIASDAAFQEYRPLNALIDHIAKWSKEGGFHYFNLGQPTLPGGTEINPGLFRFKEGFGARGTLRETMHITIESK